MKKKLLSVVLVAACALSMVACGSGNTTKSSADKTYNVGVIQLVQHPALDAATQGFQDALKEKLGDKVVFDVQNASGDSATCATIANTFVSEQKDLILGNATAALQAAVAATDSIPVLGTSITDYGTALDIANWSGSSGKNVSGTCDLAPIDEQAALILELFPEAKNIGVLYCTAEANSKYQSDLIRGYLEQKGCTVTEFSFADSNDIAAVTQAACDASEVIYVPTDNTAASCTETINSVASIAGTPIVAGEEGICSGCGVATLSISYYDLGYSTGLMAYEILANGKDISTYPVEFAKDTTKKYNKTLCDQLGITVPEGFTAIE